MASPPTRTYTKRKMDHGEGKRNIPPSEGPSSVSVEMMGNGCFFNTDSMAFERRKIQIAERRIKAKGTLSIPSLSIGLRSCRSARFCIGSSAGAKFPSSRKAAVGTFPTRSHH